MPETGDGRHQLVLYSRHACHLCDVMQTELLGCLDGFDYHLDVRDVDSRADWREAYGMRVPLLMTDAGELLCEYHLDAAVVHGWLCRQVV